MGSGWRQQGSIPEKPTPKSSPLSGKLIAWLIASGERLKFCITPSKQTAKLKSNRFYIVKIKALQIRDAAVPYTHEHAWKSPQKLAESYTFCPLVDAVHRQELPPQPTASSQRQRCHHDHNNSNHDIRRLLTHMRVPPERLIELLATLDKSCSASRGLPPAPATEQRRVAT